MKKDYEMEEKEKALLAKGWIKVWMLFEVQSGKKDAVKSALKKHVSKIHKEEGVRILKEKFTSVSKMDAPEMLKKAGIKEWYSQVAELIIMAQSFENLVNVTLNFGPSAVEILAPEKITLSMRDAQNALASVTDVMHKYAAAGVGGVLVSP